MHLIFGTNMATTKEEKYKQKITGFNIPMYRIGIIIFIKPDLMQKSDMIRQLKRIAPDLVGYKEFINVAVGDLNKNDFVAKVHNIKDDDKEDVDRLCLVLPSWAFEKDIHTLRSTICHEVSHLIDYVCDEIGMPLTMDTMEPRAYIFEYIIGRLSCDFGLFD